MGGTITAGRTAGFSPAARPSRIAAAVVDVAWLDGKLNLLGVPTPTVIAG